MNIDDSRTILHVATGLAYASRLKEMIEAAIETETGAALAGKLTIALAALLASQDAECIATIHSLLDEEIEAFRAKVEKAKAATESDLSLDDIHAAIVASKPIL